MMLSLAFLLMPAALGEREPPMLAVLAVEDGAKLEPSLSANLTEQLVQAFETSARYRLISPERLQQRIAETKECDRACQTKLAREMGAGEVLATRVVRIGSECAVTARLTKEIEIVATHEGGCSTEGLEGSITAIVAKLLPLEKPECAGPPGRATFATTPFGAKVFVDGVEVGVTPISAMKLPAGCPLQIRLVAPDGRERVETIQLDSNKVSVYRIPFEK